MKQQTLLALIIFIQIFSLFPFSEVRATTLFLSEYRNLRFWNSDIGMCFYPQDTNLSCVPASVQMVLRYLDYQPLPSQGQLATEMHTNLSSPTQWRYTYIPFQSRGFAEFYNQSFSSEFSAALSNLKGNVSQNFPAIVNTWYNEEAKAKGITHARVVTGYNSTGIFVHDPWDGPNEFMNYTRFSSLWKTDSGYWSLIVKQEPKFDLIVEAEDWFGNPIPGVAFLLQGKANRTEVTGLNGTVRFSNLTIANYTLSYGWRFEWKKYNVVIVDARKETSYLFLSDLTILIISIVVVPLLIGAAIWMIRRRKRNIETFSWSTQILLYSIN